MRIRDLKIPDYKSDSYTTDLGFPLDNFTWHNQHSLQSQREFYNSLGAIRKLNDTFREEIGERAYGSYYLENYVLDIEYILHIPESVVME